MNWLMDNKLLAIFYFPEFLLTIGCLVINLIALFIKKEPFKKISYLSILLLSAVCFSVLKNATWSFAFYDIFFIRW